MIRTCVHLVPLRYKKFFLNIRSKILIKYRDCQLIIQDYSQSQAHYFDPRSVDQRLNRSEMEISEIARSLREVSPNIQALDILEEQKPVKENRAPSDQLCPECTAFTIPNILKSVTSSHTNDFVSLTISGDSITHIESFTIEQSDNMTWHELRKGRLTASNFCKVCKAVDASKCPLSLSRTILSEYGEIIAPSLEWGKRKERAALQLLRVCQKFHVKPLLSKRGLRLHDKIGKSYFLVTYDLFCTSLTK